jgi:hypothetical protein
MCSIFGLAQPWWNMIGLGITLVGALILLWQGIGAIRRGWESDKEIENVGTAAAFGVPYAPKANKGKLSLYLLTIGVALVVIGTAFQIIGALPVWHCSDEIIVFLVADFR